MAKKILLFCVLYVGFVSSTLIAQSSQSRNNIHGAWEFRSGGDIWVIVITEHTFTFYRNGVRGLDFIYNHGPIIRGFGVEARDPQNHPRILFLMIGYTEGWGIALTYNVSANEMVLSADDASFDNQVLPSEFRFLRNAPTFRRSSFVEPSEAGNPLIGNWRREGTWKNRDGEDMAQLLRFFPNGEGVLLNFIISPVTLWGVFELEYQLGAAPRAGEISLIDLNRGRDPIAVLPFTLEGGRLLFDGAVYIKQ